LDNPTACIEAVNSLSIRFNAVSTLDSDKCSELKNFKEKQLCLSKVENIINIINS
jgi:hypothetical protein